MTLRELHSKRTQLLRCELLFLIQSFDFVLNAFLSVFTFKAFMSGRCANLVSTSKECTSLDLIRFLFRVFSICYTIKILPFDLASPPSELLGLGAQAAALWGASKVDVLVNNGGISSRSPAEDTSLEVRYHKDSRE